MNELARKQFDQSAGKASDPMKFNEAQLDSPDSQIDDDDLVSSYEFVLDMVEVEHSETDRLLESASL